MSKKIISLFFILFFTYNIVIAREQIKIVGSSTVYPFTTIVAEKHGQKGYKTPIVESTGTGGGMKLFCAGLGPKHPDFTNASRAIKRSEKELCKENGVTDIIEIKVGNDGIVFANSADHEKFNLSVADIWKAMAAKGPQPKTWKEINPELPDQKIKILAPPPTSGTRDAFCDLVMKEGCRAVGLSRKLSKKDCIRFREDGVIEEAGENDTLIDKRLDNDRETFGIFGFSFLDQNRDKIQGSLIDGVEISLESIQDNSYPISRPLYIYAKRQHVGVIPGMKEFMNEYVSDAAMGEWGYLSDEGLVPLDEETLQTVRNNVR